jgi:hypothetical protein
MHFEYSHKFSNYTTPKFLVFPEPLSFDCPGREQVVSAESRPDWKSVSSRFILLLSDNMMIVMQK